MRILLGAESERSAYGWRLHPLQSASSLQGGQIISVRLLLARLL